MSEQLPSVHSLCFWSLDSDFFPDFLTFYYDLLKGAILLNLYFTLGVKSLNNSKVESLKKTNTKTNKHKYLKWLFYQVLKFGSKECTISFCSLALLLTQRLRLRLFLGIYDWIDLQKSYLVKLNDFKGELNKTGSSLQVSIELRCLTTT